MDVKLKPKNAKFFCPGCPKKDLTLKKAPNFIIDNIEYKDSGKKISIIGKNTKKDTKTVSLF